MEQKDKDPLIISVVVLILASIIFLIIYLGGDSKNITQTNSVETSKVEGVDKARDTSIVENIDFDYKKTSIDDVLHILYVIHLSYLTDISTSKDSNLFIMNELQEAMNDRNKLNNLLYRSESLKESKDQLISVTGLSLNATLLSLINSHDVWIQYLRGVDINTVNVSEFQYQLANFQSSTHDAYLKLAEGVSLFPMIVVNFSEEGGEENNVDEDLKNYFIGQMNDKFDEILIENQTFYKETKTRYTVPIIIENYKEFLINNR